jgi:hypothetical protein
MEKNTRARVGGAERAPHVRIGKPSGIIQLETRSVVPTGQFSFFHLPRPKGLGY